MVYPADLITTKWHTATSADHYCVMLGQYDEDDDRRSAQGPFVSYDLAKAALDHDWMNHPVMWFSVGYMYPHKGVILEGPFTTKDDCDFTEYACLEVNNNHEDTSASWGVVDEAGLKVPWAQWIRRERCLQDHFVTASRSQEEAACVEEYADNGCIGCKSIHGMDLYNIGRHDAAKGEWLISSFMGDRRAYECLAQLGDKSDATQAAFTLSIHGCPQADARLAMLIVDKHPKMAYDLRVVAYLLDGIEAILIYMSREELDKRRDELLETHRPYIVNDRLKALFPELL